MFIQKYFNYKMSPAVAKMYNNSKKGKDFIVYTVDIGSTGKTLWKYFMKLGSSITSKLHPETTEVTLDGNNYYIKPARNKDGEIVKDNMGNVRYKIEEDSSDAFKNDIILFMEIPNKNYTDVKYKISGCATELAIAYIGKERTEQKTTRSPALVLEITGDFTLTYTAIDQFNKLVTGKFDFNYNTKSFTVEESTEE